MSEQENEERSKRIRKGLKMEDANIHIIVYSYYSTLLLDFSLVKIYK